MWAPWHRLPQCSSIDSVCHGKGFYLFAIAWFVVFWGPFTLKASCRSSWWAQLYLCVGMCTSVYSNLRKKKAIYFQEEFFPPIKVENKRILRNSILWHYLIAVGWFFFFNFHVVIQKQLALHSRGFSQYIFTCNDYWLLLCKTLLVYKGAFR